MGRTLVIPDIHHKTWVVDEILTSESSDEVVFLGDYFDDFNDTPDDARRTAEWLRAHAGTPGFTFLYGNHDLPYCFPVPGLDCAGFSIDKWQEILQVLDEENWKSFKLHAWVDGWLLSHAGWNRHFSGSNGQIDRSWIDKLCGECLHQLHDGKMHSLAAAGVSRGGWQSVGGITWQDWSEMAPIPALRQIVGHTPGLAVRAKGDGDSITICLDTHLCHYGCLENGDFTFKSTPLRSRHR